MNLVARFVLLCLGFAALAAAAALFLDAAEPYGALPMLLVVVFAIVTGCVLLHAILNTYNDMDQR